MTTQDKGPLKAKVKSVYIWAMQEFQWQKKLFGACSTEQHSFLHIG